MSKLSNAESNRFSAVSRDSRLDRDHNPEHSRARSRSPSISIPSRPGTSHGADIRLEAPASDDNNALGRVEPGVSTPPEAPRDKPPTEQSDIAQGAVDSQPIQHERTVDLMPEGQTSVSGLPNIPSSHGAAISDQLAPKPEHSLVVPEHQRRQSIVSTVSSASPGPATSQEGQNIHRSVSPAEANEAHHEAVPSYRPGESLSKEQEAAQDRAAAEATGTNDQLPSYEEGPAARKEERNPRIGPDAQIVPVADLSRQRRPDEVRTTNRPFSFEGSEYLNQAIRANEKQESIQSPPSLPLSPVSQTLSKSMSQVSTEDIPEDQEGARKAPKSYSRPFGADPIRDHPALRQPDHAVDRSRMYSSESPLPSARRPQQDSENVRRQSPVPAVQTQEEDGVYRIPGPHFQELRSPRRSSAQNNFSAVQQFREATSYQQPTGIGHHPQSQQESQAQAPQPPPQQFQQQQQQQQQQQPMGPPTPQTEGIPKKPRLGGFFQSKPKTRQEVEPKTEGKQRGKLYKENSRQNSVSSKQSSVNEKRDIVGQLPQTDKSKRRLSRDLMRSPTPTDQSEGKKKRFSAMGNLFSRGSKSDKSAEPQRASTLPTNAAAPSRVQDPVLAHQQRNQGQPVQPPPDGHFYRPDAQRQFSGTPPPVGGYYAPSQHRQVNDTTQHDQQSPYNYPPPAQPLYQQNEGRRSDLRIDTTSGARASPGLSMPATAPPQSYASRDISYQSRPYEYISTPSRVQSPPSTAAPPSASGSASRSHDAHVVALHKRSRSPKLGRPLSSEEQRHLAPSPAGGEAHTPVEGLGTFSNKKISPVGGIPRPAQDQEAPYRIDIPGGDLGEEERKRRARQSMIERGGIKDRESEAAKATSPTSGQPTVAERVMGPQLPAHGAKKASLTSTQQSGNAEGSRRFVAELPGSKAEGYESEEEIPMSATAYPGQWQDPVFFGDGRWDD